MKRISIYLLMLICWLVAPAQSGPAPRPSLYDLVNQVRSEIGLDQKQFDKVYAAYEKFDKAVFGNTPQNGPQGNFSNNHRPGMGGPGGPGGHRPGGGGPGMGNGHGPGNHAPGNSSMGRPGVSPSVSSHAPKPDDMEKMMKKRAQQEEKLDKTMKKLFKKDIKKYSDWKKIRQRQLSQLFPAPPSRPK